MIKHNFYSVNWTFTGFIYGPTNFCSSSIPYDLYRMLTRLSSLVEWTSCAVVYTVSHGLVRSHMVLYGFRKSHTVIYNRKYNYTWTWHSCQFFKSFKNHTCLSQIHSNSPSVTRIRPGLV